MFSQTIKPERPPFKARLRGYVSHVASFLAGLREDVLRKRTRQADAPTPPALLRLAVDRGETRAMRDGRTPMQVIMDKRKMLEAQIEAASRRSLVPDGLSLCLLENYRDESRERARLLCELEHELVGHLGRLKALCPAPPEPEPEPRRPRRFSKPSDWFPNGTPGPAK
jgi:hypothetical protein